MTQDNQEREESLFSEFERLGNNLRDAFTTAWESEERKEVQEEIRRGLSEVNRALSSLLKDVGGTPAAQQIREEIEDFSSRVREGEVSRKVRGEVATVLQRLNRELENWTQRSADSSEGGGQGSEGEDQENSE